VSIIGGLICHNGIVIASDSAATTEIDRSVASVHEMRKIEIVERRLVLAVAGHSGVARQYHDAMSKLIKEVDIDALSDNALMQQIVQYKGDAISVQLAVAKRRADLAGTAFDAKSTAAESLVAIRTTNGPRLFHVDEYMNPDVIVPESPFKIIGTGAVTTHAFTEYLRQQFLGPQPPDVGDGILTMLWAVRFAIATHARDVGGPPQITIVPSDASKEIQSVSAADLAEHQAALDLAEGRLQQLRLVIRGQGQEAVREELPEPPKQ